VTRRPLQLQVVVEVMEVEEVVELARLVVMVEVEETTHLLQRERRRAALLQRWRVGWRGQCQL